MFLAFILLAIAAVVGIILGSSFKFIFASREGGVVNLTQADIVNAPEGMMFVLTKGMLTNQSMPYLTEEMEALYLTEFSMDWITVHGTGGPLESYVGESWTLSTEAADHCGWCNRETHQLAVGNSDSFEEMKKILVHEVQHMLQYVDGRSCGGSVEEYEEQIHFLFPNVVDLGWEVLYKPYINNIGEKESRLVSRDTSYDTLLDKGYSNYSTDIAEVFPLFVENGVVSH